MQADAFAIERAGLGRTALLAANGAPWVIADLALLAARCTNVPLPGYFTDAQLRHALDDARLDAIVTDAPARMRTVHEGFRDAESLPGSGLAVLRRAAAPDGGAATPEGIAKITYTSGSTGAPAGVPLTATALEAVARSIADATAPLAVRRHLCLLPLATLLENVAGVYAALLAGAEIRLPARTGVDYGGLDAPTLLGALATHAPESCILVPELLRVLVASGERGWRVPPQLRFVAVGGATVAPELLRRAHALGLPAYEGYGLSECASVVTLNVPGANRPGSVGRPLPHARVRIDAAGEIHVRGTGAAREVATGDLGEFDADGYLHVRGRRRNVLITSFGRNVSPEWVERELLLEPAIAQACVYGEARAHPVALLVPSGAADLPRAVANANSRLPDYARVRAWRAVPPFSPADGTLTANGRVRRDRIATVHADSLATLWRALAS